ncbi:FAD-dependent oxidoreductase [Gordonia humi]|uniref:NADH dehydrogenase FAD-containing subunit n=1 Tax=Gordonia humi TaxID=686429 RepID=A0A840F842_9ACTN|nr:FAD-dependent oxidoreductase [Gordonia humi]MBB4136370.1 NADH dehydrogenase FAD-containing subunit [Gordonia humi]
MSRPRILVAGLGDSGLLTAIHLASHFEVVGISSKPGLVSGQELGLRVSRPDVWARDHRIPFDRFRRLDVVRTVHGFVRSVDVEERIVTVLGVDGRETVEPFDALVVATGVQNGFWRRPGIQTTADVDADLSGVNRTLSAARSVAIVGGGAAAVSAAANLSATWPDKRVDLFHPGTRALPRHHPRVWRTVRTRLERQDVGVHPGHRAVIPDDAVCDEITSAPVEWSTGQASTHADAVLWAVGRVVPNTSWLPADLLDEKGFVVVTPQLRVPRLPHVYAIGDVAATDDLRSSARNRADRLLAHNIRADFAGRPERSKSFVARERRWGSVLGVQADGLQVFAATGHAFRFPAWTIETILQPWIVRRGIYGGIRSADRE